ncbi:MAG: OsmC family protein [Gemmatimonadetes bacterium]|nr:OsmC family protein [Gemmatimonadota bacterium]
MSSSTDTRHEYAAHITWQGDLGEGTATYAGYGREYLVTVGGKPDLAGSADPAFRGDAGRHNPEDLFLAALSACHMLSYLALCARGGVRVTAYEDEARGSLELHPGGGGRFEEVVLRPSVAVAREETMETARRLHETAHERCFIASSCSVPVRVHPTIRLGRPAPAVPALAEGGEATP